MKKRIIMMLIAVACFFGTAHAITDYMLTANDGNIVPESPRAARFLEVTAPRAALSTGATQFDIPLYTLSVQELNLTFDLKYMSNGVKVFDDPCPVSYGWSLLPALRVTRRINGRPDELFPFLGDISYNSDGSLPDYTTLYRCVVDSGLWNLGNYTSVNRYDAEKDVFTIHLPDRNVTCIADFKNGAPKFITVNADDIKIEGDAKLTYIKVTDNRGTVYMFGKRGEYCDNDLYCNEWLLTSITLLSGDTVSFKWNQHPRFGKNRQELSPNTLSYTQKPGQVGSRDYELTVGADGDNPLIRTGNFQNQLELETVTFPGGSISLTYVTSAKGPHLTNFIVSNENGDVVKSASLNYCDLMLRSVNISGVGQYDFDYYEFEGMTTYSQDLWGYYNGDKEAFTLVPEMEISPEANGKYFSTHGAPRETDGNYMRHKLLHRVVYPTGGSTEWDHEIHRFSPVQPDSYILKHVKDITIDQGGGLRVKSITTAKDSIDTNPIVTNYIYGPGGNGLANCVAVPFLYTFVNGIRNITAYWNDFDITGKLITSVVPEIWDVTTYTITSSSNYLKCQGGTPIWYSEVTEITNEGKTEHFFEELIKDDISTGWQSILPQGLFTMASKGPVETKTIMYKGSNGIYSKISTVTSQYNVINSGPAHSMNGWSINRLISQNQSRNRQIIPDFGETGTVYLIDEPPGSDLNSGYGNIHNPAEVSVYDWGSPYEVKFYTVDLKQERLVSQTTTQHYDNGDMTSTVSFEYLDNSETPSKVTATLPDGSTRVVNLYYPTTDNNVWERMKALNLGHTPVKTTLTETIGKKSEVKTVENVYTLNGSPAIPRIRQTKAWRGTSAPVVLATYDYDRRGNLLKRMSRDSVTTTWEWDSNGLYPVKQTVSGTFVTQLTWNPLVGMTSQTIPSGLKTTYGYDTDGRLVSESLDGYGTLNTYRYYLNRGDSRIEADRWLDSNGMRRATSKALYDGLGREWLKIAVNGGGATTDVATLTEYDAMSRPIRKWSPAPLATGPLPSDRDEVTTAAVAHYGDDYPFTLIEYEPDERRQVKATTQPGTAWHTAAKSAKTRILTNVATKGSPYSCPLFTLGTDRAVTFDGLAPAGTLTVTETTDEDGLRTLTFTDARGRTVMTRTGADGDLADTRFVYNGYDDLLCVLPPMLEAKDYPGTDADLMAYAYFYDYDERGQCIAKKLPGRDELKMRYDPAGRMVATQDGNQRKKSTWTVYMFDRYGREALVATAGTMPGEIEEFARHINHVEYTGDPENAGYSPAIALPFMLDVETAEYYDSYGFTALCSELRPGETVAATLMTAPIGLRTGGYSGGSQFETVYYDQYGRPVYSASLTGVGRAETTTEYTYSGQVKKTTSTAAGTDLVTNYLYDTMDRPTSVTADLDGMTSIAPVGEFAPVEFPTLPPSILPGVEDNSDMSVKLTYGLTGTLDMAKFGKVSQSVKRDCGGREIERTVSLPFNIKIPTVRPLSLQPVPGGDITEATRDITEVLKYADATVPAYNGNVGQRIYADASWTYHYDSHNRLKKAAYRSETNTENFSTEYTYDRHANITRLKKWGLYEPSTGDCALIDDLRITYDGNQAVDVEDYGEDPVFENAGGYNTRSGLGIMTYDANGNMTADSCRAIAKIEYNRLNQPKTIYFRDGHRQTISYDGRGTKLSVTYSTATTPVLANGTARRYKTDYIRRYGAGRVMRGDSVEMVMHPYGYFDGNGEVRYYLHDFQGNVTMTVDGKGTVLQHSRYYPYGEAIDAFAASEVSPTATDADRNQPYLYGGKELERMHGLGEYDFGARRLSSHLPLWTTQDPCLEKYYPTSPYSYCAGNPIRYIDPSGMDAVFSDKVSIQQIINILLELQKLSDDNLIVRFKDDGKRYLEYKANPLETLKINAIGKGKAKGTSLLRQVIDHKKTLIIDCNNSRNQKDEDGKLLDCTSQYTTTVTNKNIVNFDFNDHSECYILKRNGDILAEEIPAFIKFGHELIHGLRYLNGENSSRTTRTHRFKIGVFYYYDYRYSDEEWSTVGIGPNPYKISENDLRRENGLNPRVSYGKPDSVYPTPD